MRDPGPAVRIDATLDNIRAPRRGELLDRKYSSTQLLRRKFEMIKASYNNRRRKRRLGKFTPVEFKLAFSAAQAACCSKPVPGELGANPG